MVDEFGEMNVTDFYMLVRKGLVQRHTATTPNGRSLIWPVAESHEDAAKLALFFSKGRDTGVRAARIGEVQGETLEGHLAMAMEEGCVAVACVAGWEPDGRPKGKWLPIPGG